MKALATVFSLNNSERFLIDLWSGGFRSEPSNIKHSPGSNTLTAAAAACGKPGVCWRPKVVLMAVRRALAGCSKYAPTDDKCKGGELEDLSGSAISFLNVV